MPVKESCEKQGLDCTRLRDAGYRGEETDRRFTIKNICDFVVFDGKTLLYMEAKHRKDRVELKGLTQLDELLKKEKTKRAFANVANGFLICLKNRFFYIPVLAVEAFVLRGEKKSINLDDCLGIGFEVFTFIPKGARKPRINIADMMDKLGVLI